MRRFFCSITLAVVILACSWNQSNAEEKKSRLTKIVRLFLQDHQARTLKWADIFHSTDGKFTVETWRPIEGFPNLDPETQTFVQMGETSGRILVGIRDKDQGKIASGWVILSAGSKFREHGDHGHWDYSKAPFVLESRIDKDQGNPAHVYEYDGNFYVANDSKNGFTQLEPENWFRSAGGDINKGKPRFFLGGGNHITLAAVNNKVAYSSWIDGGGPNKGRIDMVSLEKDPTTSGSVKGGSFVLPSGLIHGADSCGGKVFFAPANGICWVEADPALRTAPKDVKIHHISLGMDKDNKKPLRTGAFAQLKNHLFCVTGQEKSARLVILDAEATDPKPLFLPLNGLEFHKPLTPALVLVGEKKPYALVFHDHDKKYPTDDLLEVFELDPNGDGKFQDARHVKTLKVGPSLVEGHHGHHSVAFDAEGLFAFITNPGDATISILDLKTLTISGSLKAGGEPGAILAHGANETEE